MKRKIMFSFFLLVSIIGFSEEFSSYSKILYEHNSHHYDDLYLACMEDGIALLSYKKPASVAELLLNYNWINPENLSPQGSLAYSELGKLFFDYKPAFFKNQFGLDYNLSLALEARYLFNPKNEPAVDKLYRYNKSLEPIKLPLEFYLSPYAYLYFAPTLGKNYSGFNLSYPYTNLPLAQNALDYHFPKQTGLAVGNKFFNLHIGRGQLTVGKTLSGSMLIADAADRLDYFNASAFFDYAKFDLTVVELAPTSFFISHEISIRPVKQFSITLHEGVMLDSVFDPKLLNPFMIIHNYAPWKQPYVGHENNSNSFGCQLGFDINIVPIKNLRIYGQFGMNQFQTVSELKNGHNKVPNSMGGNFGLEYIFAVLGGHLILTGEFLYADPWLYIGFGGYKVSFFSHREENVYASKSYEDSRIDFWLANPYGPDTIAGFLKLEFIDIKTQLALSYRLLVKGENEEKFLRKARNKEFYYPDKSHSGKPDTLTDEEARQMAAWKTPSGNPTYFNTVGLSGKYKILDNLELISNFSWTIAFGKISGNSIDFNTAIRYSIR